jgi:hypothetical protein
MKWGSALCPVCGKSRRYVNHAACSRITKAANSHYTTRAKEDASEEEIDIWLKLARES